MDFGTFVTNILNNKAVIIFIITIALTVFSRMVIKIFRFGMTYKTELATKKEQQEFEEQIKKDMRSYKDEVTKNVMVTCMRVIDERLKDLDEVKEMSDDMKITKTKLEVQINNALEKYDEIKSLGENVRLLSNKVNRLEYGDKNEAVRRSDDNNGI